MLRAVLFATVLLVPSVAAAHWGCWGWRCPPVGPPVQVQVPARTFYYYGYPTRGQVRRAIRRSMWASPYIYIAPAPAGSTGNGQG